MNLSKDITAVAGDYQADLPEVISREDLYALAWREPMSRLSRRFGLSDVGLAVGPRLGVAGPRSDVAYAGRTRRHTR
jgi:hypothetical protein